MTGPGGDSFNFQAIYTLTGGQSFSFEGLTIDSLVAASFDVIFNQSSSASIRGSADYSSDAASGSAFPSGADPPSDPGQWVRLQAIPPEPVPTLTEWGIFSLIVLLAGAAFLHSRSAKVWCDRPHK